MLEHREPCIPSCQPKGFPLRPTYTSHQQAFCLWSAQWGALGEFGQRYAREVPGGLLKGGEDGALRPSGGIL